MDTIKVEQKVNRRTRTQNEAEKKNCLIRSCRNQCGKNTQSAELRMVYNVD